MLRYVAYQSLLNMLCLLCADVLLQAARLYAGLLEFGYFAAALVSLSQRPLNAVTAAHRLLGAEA